MKFHFTTSFYVRNFRDEFSSLDTANKYVWVVSSVEIDGASE